MAEFEIALKITLGNEGIYSADPVDAGGETCFGISRRYHPDWPGLGTVDRYKTDKRFPEILAGDEVLRDEVNRFYKVKFWDALLLDKVKNQKVANLLFDTAVNIGVNQTLALCNLTTGKNNQQFNLDLIGDINRMDSLFIYKFTIYRISRYSYLVHTNPNNKKFFYGWVKRCLVFV
mgnify:CR=1 FL=1